MAHTRQTANPRLHAARPREQVAGPTGCQTVTVQEPRLLQMRRSGDVRIPISPLEGEMSGRTEGGAARTDEDSRNHPAGP